MSRLETLQSSGAAARGPQAAAVRELGPWFQNLHLLDGTETAPDHPLGDFPQVKWQGILAHLPISLDGLRVLDVGCNAGFHAFEMSRLGADVVAAELDEHYLRQARWAEDHVASGRPVQFRQASVYDVATWQARFDLVNFQGVLYHLRYPMLALDLLAQVCDRWLIFQSLTLPSQRNAPPYSCPDNVELDQRQALDDPDWPRLAFIEKRFAGDFSNWWVPNESAVFAMLRTAGFEPHTWLGPETWLCRRNDQPGGARLQYSW